MAIRLVLVIFVVGLLASAGVAAAGRVEGRVVDQSALALPGVTVRLVASDGAVRSVVTGANGEYAFDALPGDYRIEATLDGFAPGSATVRVSDVTAVPDIVLALGHFSQETTVVAAAPTEVQPRQFGAPATIAEKVIDNAPLRTNRYDDVLPLLPNVVRGPDGMISVAGARAPQGVVLLNGVPGIDIASGEPSAPVPLAAVESVQVIATGFPAEFGRSTGGVTVVNTRAGGDALRFTVNSFTPRPRLDEGGVRGIEAWQPNMGIRGPLSPGRAWFAQSLDYRYDRTKVDTRAGDQDRRLNSFNSLSQVDVRLRPGHVVTAWFSGQRERVNGWGLGAFTPLQTVPDLRRGAWSGAVVDRLTLGDDSTLETRIDVRQQSLSLLPRDSGPYVVAHDLTYGSYFATLKHDALSVQASTVLSRVIAGVAGNHLVKVGGSVVRATLDGNGTARPVTFLDSRGAAAQYVDFVGPGTFSADAVDAGAFVQDTWTLRDNLALDAGLRLDRGSGVGGGAAPRAGLTWKAGEETTVTGGAGLFTDKLALAALAFPGFQSRRVTLGSSAAASASPVTYYYRNAVANRLSRARAWMWSAQVDRRLHPNWQVRVGYRERQGSRELVVQPETAAGGERLALLTSGGHSHARSLETTLGFRPPSLARQFYVSYVRSSARGNTNDFNQVEAILREPLLQPGEEAPLPADAPHRLLVWGVFSLPARTTVAPFLEVRSGFPYSAIDDGWTYVGPRNTHRYPAFASLDVIVNKVVTLPRELRARVGVKLYNLAGRRNGRDVQQDIERADFGATYNALGRQVRGVFEIMW